MSRTLTNVLEDLAKAVDETRERLGCDVDVVSSGSGKTTIIWQDEGRCMTVFVDLAKGDVYFGRS